MRRAVPVLLACLALALLADDKDATRKRIEAGKKALDADQAKRRADLADWCANKGLFKEAREEYDRAIALAGGNEKWERDRDNLAARQGRRPRPGREKDREEERQEYGKARGRLQEGYAKLYAELAKQAKEAGLDDLASSLEAAAGGASPPAPTPPSDDPPDEGPPKNGKKVAPPVYSPEQAAERVNWYRQTAGLDPAALDADLSKGAAAHANYLSVNDVPMGLGAHDEDKDLPGYTPEGKAAGQASDICWGPPANSVDELMSELFHRIPILRPTLARIGVGYANGGRITVIDLTQGLSATDVERVIVWPVPDQKDVPTRFGSESPNPIPPGAPRSAGYPVTLTQYDRSFKITDATATLVDAEGAEVEVHLSTPEKPAHPVYQLNTVGMIPVHPLSGGATYTATVRCRMGGVPYEKSWSFTTK